MADETTHPSADPIGTVRVDPRHQLEDPNARRVIAVDASSWSQPTCRWVEVTGVELGGDPLADDEVVDWPTQTLVELAHVLGLPARVAIELDPSQIPEALRVSDVQRTFRAAGMALRFELDENAPEEQTGDRPLIGPQPRFPTPWRSTVIHSGLVAIESADGREAARTHEPTVAELVVRLVNREAHPGVVNLFEANEALQELGGQLAEATAENDRLTRMVEWLCTKHHVAGHNTYDGRECACGEQVADVVAWQWHRFNATT